MNNLGFIVHIHKGEIGYYSNRKIKHTVDGVIELLMIGIVIAMASWSPFAFLGIRLDPTRDVQIELIQAQYSK